MAFDYTPYIRKDKFPNIWCPGCGIGILMKAIIRAVHKMGWKREDVALVSGIGCTSRMPGYVNFNTLHTTHGRALAFATGIKHARPDKHVIVVSGDGDALAIGGNHFVHACRRNIDITLMVLNNMIYGMTGGQVSPTTPAGYRASTMPYGNVEPNFDTVALASGAGATFVARSTVNNPALMERQIKEGLQNKGFSVIEVVSNCHIQFGRRNKMGDQIVMRHWIKDREVPLRKAKDMSEEELQGKFVIGTFVKKTRPEYTEEYAKMVERVKGSSK